MSNLKRLACALAFALAGGGCVSTVAIAEDADQTLCRDSDEEELADQRIEACTRLIEAGLGGSRSQALYYSRRAEGFEDTKQYPLALADLDKAIELQPDTGYLYARRGYLYDVGGNLKAADEEFAKAAAMAPQSGMVHFLRGLHFMRARQDESAISEFGESIRIDPEDSVSILARGQVHARNDDHAAAIVDYARYIELRPKEAIGYLRRGKVLQDQGDTEAAIKDLDEAIRLDPKEDEAYAVRSFAWRDMGDDDKALADVDASAQLAPDTFAYQHNRCSLRLILDREMDTALAACGEALRLSPGNHNALSSRGVVLLKLGRAQEALADFDSCAQTLIAMQPADREALDVAFCRYGRAISTTRLEGRQGPNRKQIGEDFEAATDLAPSVLWTFREYGISP